MVRTLCSLGKLLVERSSIKKKKKHKKERNKNVTLAQTPNPVERFRMLFGLGNRVVEG